MQYYLRRFIDQFDNETSHVWAVTDSTAHRYGFENVETGVDIFFQAQDGGTAWDAMRLATTWFNENDASPFHLMEIPPGHYFPRMARPVNFLWTPTPDLPQWDTGDSHVAAIAVGQLSSLIRHLERIFQVVHPYGENLNAYGNEIRNLLILACTEVESQWRGILVSNGVSKSRFKTDEYIWLKDALRLGEYSVGYPTYPWLPTSSPFQMWNKEKPTQSLSWYDAYNAVKHNREGEFRRATLQHVVDAVTACAVLIMAQYGDDSVVWSRSDARDFFRFISRAQWPPHQQYFYPIVSRVWSPVPFKFVA